MIFLRKNNSEKIRTAIFRVFFSLKSGNRANPIAS